MSAEPTRPDDPGGTPTATRLLDVAEQLFARHGIDNVSLRRIVRASGQANLSAAHYHFGSREALIRAVVERRLRTIDAIRHRNLDRVVEQGRADDLRAIIAAAVHALADVVRDTPWGADYVRVLAQALFDPRVALLDSVDPVALSGIARVRAMAGRLLPEVRGARFEARAMIVHHETSYAIARWVHAHGAPGPRTLAAWTTMVEDLAAFMAAGVAAPVAAG